MKNLEDIGQQWLGESTLQETSTVHRPTRNFLPFMTSLDKRNPLVL